MTQQNISSSTIFPCPRYSPPPPVPPPLSTTPLSCPRLYSNVLFTSVSKTEKGSRGIEEVTLKINQLPRFLLPPPRPLISLSPIFLVRILQIYVIRHTFIDLE